MELSQKDVGGGLDFLDLLFMRQMHVDDEMYAR